MSVSPPERVKFVVSLGMKAKDTAWWYHKYLAKVSTSRNRDIACTLTFEQYVKLASMAGLKRPDQIGKSHGKYQLGRHGDAGGYTFRNCRFITVEQNALERALNGGNAEISRKLTGRNAVNDPSRAAATAKLTGRSKHEYANLAEQADRQSKSFVAVDPSGKRHRGRNLTEFCKARKLSQGNMGMVFNGNRNHHKGWTGHYIE